MDYRAKPGEYVELSSTNGSLEWKEVPGEPLGVEETVLHANPDGSYTHLLRIEKGVEIPGPVVHDFFEEAFYLQGRLLNTHTKEFITGGSYVFHEPGEEHGPFRCIERCLILEFRYYKQSSRNEEETKPK